MTQAGVCELTLAEIEVFGVLELEDVREIEHATHVVDIPKGHWLFMEGDPRSDVYSLVEGRIKISRLSGIGRELILELVEPGEMFGESGLFDDAPHDSYGVAFEDSRVAIVPSSQLKNLMKRRPDLYLRLAKLVDLRRKRLERRLVSLAFQKVRGRVASLLLQLCQDYGVRRNDGIKLGITLRHHEMASLIGASREIVSHTLSDFRRKGLIDTDGRKLIVRQALRLEEIEGVAGPREETME